MPPKSHEKPKGVDLKVYSSHEWDPCPMVGFAPSAAAFRRMTGISIRESVQVNNSPEARRLAEKAGEGFFMKKVRTREGVLRFERAQSKEALYQVALVEMREIVSGKGNAPKIHIERDRNRADTPNNRLTFFKQSSRHIVFIDDEERAYWERDTSAYWCLRDMEGNLVQLRSYFYLNEENQVIQEQLEECQPSRRADLAAWDEIVALRMVLQAWEDGSLPPVQVQKELASLRRSEKLEEARLKKAFEKIMEQHEKLERVLFFARGQGSVEAEELLNFLTPNDDRTSLNKDDTSKKLNFARHK